MSSLLEKKTNNEKKNYRIKTKVLKYKSIKFEKLNMR